MTGKYADGEYATYIVPVPGQAEGNQRLGQEMSTMDLRS